ncbi:MAG: NTP transferase domain-containing protein [Chloroflexi bacterium]|nr:NTP transferase domain-containing protein [Chloroflexota bacterium]
MRKRWPSSWMPPLRRSMIWRPSSSARFTAAHSLSAGFSMSAVSSNAGFVIAASIAAAWAATVARRRSRAGGAMLSGRREEASMEPLGVVLTAGLGTRLRPLTPATPKPLVPLLNRPLIAYALDLMRDLGLGEVVVVTGPDDDRTREYVEAQAPPDLRVSAAVQRHPRGPGDAVASVGDALDGRTVVVLAVDTVLAGVDPRLLDGFEASGATAGLLLQSVEDPRAFGVAVLDGDRVVDLEEKPELPRSDLALVGLWVLAPAAVERVRTDPYINARGESDLTATVGAMLAEGHDVRGWLLGGEWLDGGTIDGLLHAQSRLLARAADEIAVAPRTLVTDSALHAPVRIGEAARVEASDLAETVVGPGATLEGVTLRRALVAPGATLRGGEYADVVVTAAGEVCGPGTEA